MLDIKQMKTDKELLLAINKSIIFFVVHSLKAIPTPDQMKVLETIERDSRKISIRSGHGTGKTTLLAWIILWVGLTKVDAKIPATAPTHHQLYDLLMPEIKKWYSNLPAQFQHLIEFKSDEIRFKNGNFSVFRTARRDQPEALAGFHGSYILFIIDEASGIPENIFEVLEGALTGGTALVIMTSNPTRVDGYFYESHHKSRQLWDTFHFNSENNPNVKPLWVEEMAVKYGRDSDVFRVRVQGDFPRQSTDSMFSIEMLETAIQNEEYDNSGVIVWGVDVARFGDDSSCLAKRHGKEIAQIQVRRQLDTMAVAGWIASEYHSSKTKPDAIFVDTIGVGGGVFDRLHSLGISCVMSANVAQSPVDPRYLNKRAEMYFKLKDFFRTGGKMVDDDELIGELSSIKYEFTDNGKLKLEAKDKTKVRLGRSPDKADAVALTLFDDVSAYSYDSSYSYDDFKPNNIF